MNKPNPDDRRDNADKIRQNIEATRRNIEAAEEMIAETSDEKMRRALTAKNERREEAIPDMEHEMKEEAENQRL